MFVGGKYHSLIVNIGDDRDKSIETRKRTCSEAVRYKVAPLRRMMKQKKHGVFKSAADHRVSTRRTRISMVGLQEKR